MLSLSCVLRRSGVFEADSSYSVAMRAEDEAANTSPVSNIVQLSTAPRLAELVSESAANTFSVQHLLFIAVNIIMAAFNYV